VAKAYPEEKVGVFAQRNGALEVVEYSGEWGGGGGGISAWCAAPSRAGPGMAVGGLQ
jgi:hypothetical protein